MFSIQLCRATSELIAGKEFSQTVLIESFSEYVSSNDAAALQADGKVGLNQTKLIDALLKYGIRTLPTKLNAMDLIVKSWKV